MYKDAIRKLIEQSPLEIDTDIQLSGSPPTMANSEFLTNKEQGDWAERIVLKAVNEYSDDYFAVKYGRSESISAGDEGFANFYIAYQKELNSIEKGRTYSYSKSVIFLCAPWILKMMSR